MNEQVPINKDQKSNLGGLAESSFILALATSLLYSITITYYISYFNRLSIPYLDINFPNSLYLFSFGKGLLFFLELIIMILASAIGIYFWLKSIRYYLNRDRGHRHALRLITIFFSTILAILVYLKLFLFFYDLHYKIGFSLSGTITVFFY